MVGNTDEKRRARGASASFGSLFAEALRPESRRSGAALPEGSNPAEREVLDPFWVVRLLRLGFLFAILTVLGDIAQLLVLRPPEMYRMLPFDLIGLAISVAAAVTSFDVRFPRHWKIVTLAFCLSIIAESTAGSVILGDHVRFFLAIMVLLTATCALVPWEIWWQVILTAGFFAAAAINTVLVRPVTVQVGGLWLAIIATATVALASNRFWARWRRTLIETCRRLERAEAKLRKIFEASPDTICINSLRDGRYIDLNAQFTRTGYTREEIMKKPADTLTMWANQQQFLLFAQALASRGSVQDMEADFRLKDGSVHPCRISAAIVELDGEPCAVTFISPIGQLKRTERELIAAREAALAASRAKSEFLSSMSHEIRTPMNAILGMADLLAETPLNSEQRIFVETMTSNGNALLDLINGILDMAKVESGRLYLEETKFDLAELVERVAETLSGRAHEKGLELGMRILPDVPLQLIGDPLRLRQVLINLIGNAIKFTASGEVLLTVENSPRAAIDGGGAGECQLRFSVRDTGIGIPNEHLEIIFQSFTQADSSVTRRYGGSGLGLAIARRLVELMSGTIWAESAVDCGSAFFFTARFKPAAALSVEVAAPPALGGLRVLIVDDNANCRLILREILGAWGTEVGEAASGKAALAMAKRARETGTPYQVAVIDCGMAEMDGFKLAKRLSRQKKDGLALVMMLTAEGLSPKLARLRRSGLPYVVKPVKRKELMQAIAAATGKERASQPSPAAAQSNEASSDSSRPLQILLVEDSPDNRMLIQAYVKGFPYKLDPAENGEVAVEKFMCGRYDLVLMDMQMPVMDGYTATRRIRSWEIDQGRPATPIVALTASALEEDVRNTLEAGCTTHLSKPVKKSRLLAMIVEMVNGCAPVEGPGVAPPDGSIASSNGDRATASGHGTRVIVLDALAEAKNE